MSFYKLSSGEKPKGDESANMESFTIIPEGTTATAQIVKAEYVETEQWGNYYEFEYQLVDGEFKKLHVKQKVKCFDSDANKKDRALNMLVRIMTLCQHMPTHSMAPTTTDLQPLVGKQLMVKVGQWDMNGNTGNFVRGVYGRGEKTVETGVYQEPKSEKPDEINPPPVGYPQSSGGHGMAGELNDAVPF